MFQIFPVQNLKQETGAALLKELGINFGNSLKRKNFDICK